MQTRPPFIWNQNLVMFNNSQPWTQNYAKARDLIQELSNPETKNRSELIKDRLNDNPEIIAQEVQKILETDLKKVKEKIVSIIDQSKQVRCGTVKPGDKIMNDIEAIRKLKAEIGRKAKSKPNEYISSDDLTLFELADKYEKLCTKKEDTKKDRK